VGTEFRPDAFAGWRVVVTGAMSGIGAAFASGFAELGAHVTAAGLPSAGASAGASDEVANDGLDRVAEVAELDVTAAPEIERFFESQERLDVLVNCAGVLRRAEEYQMDVFRRVLEVNLVGTMRTCVAARELLIATQGSIVNVGSMFSFFGSGHAPAYGASKAAVVQLTKSLAASFAPHVRVNAVAPGWIRTAMTSPLREDPEAERRIISRTPAGRWGEPADIVGPVLWLASTAAAFVTGAVVPVDGGYSSA
jgi:NAD(P)-dependent dehydrogenase (short-subunit alcohol dehydrogenase family)